MEAELDFIVFDDLLHAIENLICAVIDILLADSESTSYIKELNPDFKALLRPFRRMPYAEAIIWLFDHGIQTDDGKCHLFGDEIPLATERRLVNEIGVPILLTHFPGHTMPFCMKKAVDDHVFVEGVHCLVPGMGEILGGGMRIENLEELLESMRERKMDETAYAFYTDQRM